LVQQSGTGAPITVGAGSGGATVTFAGSGGARQLTGVADGVVAAGSRDAVNGAQLAQTNQAIGAVVNLVVGQALGGFTSNNTSFATIPVASGSDAAAGGAGARATGNQSVAVGNASAASANQSTALGNSAQSTGTNSVALGAGSTDEGEANVVSVGSTAVTRRITNVSSGVRASDAVNLGQLASGLDQSLALANAYTDIRIQQLGFDLEKFNRDANAGTAAAMAVAAIPQAMEPGQGMVGGGVATWQGQQAFALGLSKSTPDGKFVVKAGATYTTRGKGGASAGVGFAF
jgi:autotransporter adhesin